MIEARITSGVAYFTIASGSSRPPVVGISTILYPSSARAASGIFTEACSPADVKIVFPLKRGLACALPKMARLFASVPPEVKRTVPPVVSPTVFAMVCRAFFRTVSASFPIPWSDDGLPYSLLATER